MAYEKRMIDGKEHLIAIVEFDLGEIKDEERRNDENGNTVITMPMHIKSLMSALHETLINQVVNEKWKRFDETLKEYCNLYMNDVIGVESHPIRYDREGKLVGLKKEAELNE